MVNEKAVLEAFRQMKTLAVADQILIDPVGGTLVQRIGELVKAIQTYSETWYKAYQTLIRLGLNLVGRDVWIAGYEDGEIKAGLENVLSAVDAAQAQPGVKEFVVTEILGEMESVNKGDSLPGLWAERIRPRLDMNNPGRSFLLLMQEQMQDCIYWQMVAQGYCKFGNDYARGLEYLRHLGFCQVSTNPVLAGRAFEEDPTLAEELKVEIVEHKDWLQNPEKYARQMAMVATLRVILRNIAIFRPLALFTKLQDFQVSLQLNPEIAHLAQVSLDDAGYVWGRAIAFLQGYDRLLGLEDIVAGTTPPNIVFKVAASHKAALRITRRLNSLGMGTNNTLTYSVAQEVYLFLEAIKGKAEALKRGLPVVRTYMTNMGGRLTSHLREVEAVRIFKELLKKRGAGRTLEMLDALADALGINKDFWANLAQNSILTKAEIACSFQYLKSLTHPVFLKICEEELGYSLKPMEQALQMAGSLVAQRVWWIFFDPQNFEKWVRYIKRAYKLNEEQAIWILRSMDCLPASKRIPEDTLLTLGENMTNTEFPNHARAVQLYSETPGFDLTSFQDSIRGGQIDQGILKGTIFDFRRAYDLTPHLKYVLGALGIETRYLGVQGVTPPAWPTFGPVQKTSNEFQVAFLKFVEMCVGIAKEVAGEHSRSAKARELCSP